MRAPHSLSIVTASASTSSIRLAWGIDVSSGRNTAHPTPRSTGSAVSGAPLFCMRLPLSHLVPARTDEREGGQRALGRGSEQVRRRVGLAAGVDGEGVSGESPRSDWPSDKFPGTTFVAETKLPTNFGRTYRVRAYRHSYDGLSVTEPMAIIYGDVEGRRAEVPVRVHDACFTSEVLGSLKCDCAEQLDLALEYIADETTGPGLVVYLQQEGRGIGLANKIAAYSMQEQGYDTVDANRVLGLPDDNREYSAVAAILRDLGIESIVLLTNNPRKISRLASLGVDVVGRVPVVVRSNVFSRGYLASKRTRMDHLLADEDDGTWTSCVWQHDGGNDITRGWSRHGSRNSGDDT